ncbi:MAG TPA: hypothetical protein GX529_06990 [Firmicutes bacterium]|nr:hypothetical protein [Candidatus Fermentithermobacillaceae bacterium]
MDLMLLAAEAEAAVPKWGIFVDVEGAISGLLTTLILTGLTYYWITAARAGRNIPSIRRLPGLDAITEAVGRATEMGRPVMLANRRDGLGDVETFALWGYLSHAATLAAQYDTRFINLTGSHLVLAVNEAVIQQAYLEAGRPDAFNQDDCRYFPSNQWPWSSHCAGIIMRERPAALLWVGSWSGEASILPEAGSQIEAIQIAAVTTTGQLPFFIASCDYVLMSGEVYAASAYLSKEPVMTGTIVAEDCAKLLLMAIAVLGALVEIARPASQWMTNLLKF